MNRIEAVRYTLRHRRALNHIAAKYGYSFPLHDVDKLFLYLIFGKKTTGKIHRLYSRHHERPNKKTGRLDIQNKLEAIFDWESSRYTKPDKPMTAYQYWVSACPEVDLWSLFCQLGLLPNDKSFVECLNEVTRAREAKLAKLRKIKVA